MAIDSQLGSHKLKKWVFIQCKKNKLFDNDIDNQNESKLGTDSSESKWERECVGWATWTERTSATCRQWKAQHDKCTLNHGGLYWSVEGHTAKDIVTNFNRWWRYLQDSIQFNSNNFNYPTRGNFVVVMVGL